MKIDKLEYYSTSNDRYVWERHPNKDDIVKKINEIIDALNKMDEVEKKEIKKICLLSNGTLKKEYNMPNLIRCKDCKHWYPNQNFMEDSTFYYCSNLGVDMDADDFCSRGEKND